MSCERFEDRLLDLACGELPPREAREVEAHAASCPTCGPKLAGMRATRRTMAALAAEPAPEAGVGILLAAGRAQAERNAARRRRRAVVWLAPMAAAAGLAVAVSWQVLRERPGPLERDDPDAMVAKGVPRAAEEARAPASTPIGGSTPAAKATADPAAPPAAAGSSAATATATADSTPAPARAPVPARPPGKLARRAQERAEAAGDGYASETPASAPAWAAAPAEARGARDVDEGPALAPAPRPALAERQAAVRSAEAPAAAMAPAEAVDAAAVARARYASLRAAGQLRGEVRTFPGCDAELWRKVEVDPRGQVVFYVREGTIGGRRVRVEHLYDARGALVAATAFELDGDGPGLPAEELGLRPPARAEAAGAGAPPRCAE